MKEKGKQYHSLHSMDCYIYVTECKTCKEKVGGWTPKEADELWDKHECKKN